MTDTEAKENTHEIKLAIMRAFTLGYYYGKYTDGTLNEANALFKQLENFAAAAKAAAIAIDEHESPK